ncbi:hypothetical protein PG985_012887 [Apiospora marii]|uniref:Uncharacterized protein n=1 Tax=Apiospora marii TaxID=335849 RepID=A0ABR1RD49_9PEZI
MDSYKPKNLASSADQAASSNLDSILGSASPGKLSHVVIIPQRRPNKRERGFIRAYAPELYHCGIDQATFLAFIDGLNEVVSAHPILGAFNLAGAAAGWIPQAVTPIAGPIGLGVQVVARVVTEVKARSSQNSYLEKMNDELFRPRGLYCLIMAYDIRSRSDVVQFDLGADQNITAAGPSPVPSPTPTPGTSHSQGRFRSNDGIAGAAEFPASAELVFLDPHNDPPPAYDDGSSSSSSSDNEKSEENSVKAGPSGGGSGFTGKLAKVTDSLQSWADLRSQRKFQRKNPTSAIGPLLDPKVEMSPRDLRKQEKREAKQERRADKRERKAEKRQRRHPDREPRKRKVKPGILYLMIVNIPSAAEMNTANHLLNANAMQSRDGEEKLAEKSY